MPVRGGRVRFAQEVPAGSEPPLPGSINAVDQRNKSGALSYSSLDALSADPARVIAPARDSSIRSAELFGTLPTGRDMTISQENLVENGPPGTAPLAAAGGPVDPRRVDAADPQVGDLGDGQITPVPSLAPLSSDPVSQDPFSLPASPSSDELRSPSDSDFPAFPGALALPETTDSLRVVPKVNIAAQRTAPEPSSLALLLIGGIGAVRALRRRTRARD